MHDPCASPPAPPRPRNASLGRVPLAVAALLALVIGLSLALIYKPWDRLRYGNVEPPLPPTAGMELPLRARIEERVASVRAQPYDAQAWGKLGQTYDVHEHFAEADVCYARASELAPEEARWFYLRGVLLSVGNQQAAIAALESALKLQPDLAPAHYQLGQLYLATERAPEAEQRFQRALELEPEALAARIGLANVALARGEPKRALEILEQAGQAKPDSQELRRLQASAWRALGDDDKAKSLASASDGPPARESFPDALRGDLEREEGVSLKLVRMRAESWLARSEPQRALAELNAYLEQSPKSAPALVALADLHMRLDQVEEAIARYQAAVTLDGGNVAALSQWGTALARIGRADQGIEKLRQAMALEPNQLEVRSNLGSMLCGSEDPELRKEGLNLLAETLQQHPDHASLRLNFAQALRANERFEEALAAFQRALELAPDNLRARFEYGLLCAQMGRFQDAADAFAQVVAADPARRPAHDNLIWTLTRMGRDRDAIAALRRALEVAPNDALLGGQLAWLLSTSSDDGARSGAEALVIARSLAEHSQSKNAEFQVLLSAAQAETGDLAAALVSVNQALDLLKPVPGKVVDDQSQVAIIERALSCKRAYESGKPFRREAPK